MPSKFLSVAMEFEYITQALFNNLTPMLAVMPQPGPQVT